MTPEQQQVARNALYEVLMIAGIMKGLARGAISGEQQIEAENIEWLSARLHDVEEKASEAVRRALPEPGA